MKLELVTYPHDILSTVCKPAPEEGPESRRRFRQQMAINMWKIMKENNGVGLAAPQVGLDIRMFVWLENGHPQAIWNPEVSSLSGEATIEEGCLSLPGIRQKMTRPTSGILRGSGMNGRPIMFVGGTQNTRIWCHEIDHLDGITLLDHMTEEQREKAISSLTVK